VREWIAARLEKFADDAFPACRQPPPVFVAVENSMAGDLAASKALASRRRWFCSPKWGRI
jgi:hypothetical protein